MKLFILFFLTFISLQVRAAESADAPVDPAYERSLYYWQQAQDQVQKIGSQCMECSVAQAGQADSACQLRWNKFYAKKTIDLRIMLGYMDFGKHTRDRSTAQSLIDLITDGCDPGMNLCGFKREPDDDRYFTKPMLVGNKVKTIRIQIATSSLSDNDDINTGKGGDPQGIKALQAKHSSEMHDLFQKSLVEADATFYFGHARYGAGPDFSPPVRNKDGSRARSYYENLANQKNKKEMLDVLKSSPKKTKILGFFGCDAEAHFASDLKAAAPDVATLLPEGNAYPESAVTQIYGALDSILGRRCADDFDAATNTTKAITVLNTKKRPETIPVPPVKLDGFFKH